MIKSVFLANENYPYFTEVKIDFNGNDDDSADAKRENVRLLHSEFGKADKTPVLEISTKSDFEYGRQLSAFNLHKFVKSKGRAYPVENIYQSSKVFTGNKSFDFYSITPKEIKKEHSYISEMKVTGYSHEGTVYPADPYFYFFDMIYFSALFENPELMEELLKYSAFTDIEYDTLNGVNCQARTAAQFASLYRLKIITSADDFLSKKLFIK